MKFDQIPVTKVLIGSMIVVFLLYFTTILKATPCESVAGLRPLPASPVTNFGQVFMSNFVHTDFYHLLGNLMALYGLSRMEEKLGMKKFVLLTAYLLVMNSIIEVSLHKILGIPCGIGFSGVIFGFLTFEMTIEKKVDIYLGLSVLSMVMGSVKGTHISLMGHAVGAFSGVFSGLILKAFLYDSVKKS